MTTEMLRAKSQRIRKIAQAHGVARLRVFGSQVSRRATASSDLDLLVRLKSDRDLLDLVALKLELEDVLGCKVDVVSEGGLSPYLRDRILQQAQPLS